MDDRFEFEQVKTDIAAAPRATLRRRLGLGTAAVALVTGLTVAGAVAAPPADAGQTRDVVRQSLDSLVRDDGFPGALASVRDRSGHVQEYTAGVGDLKTRTGVPRDGYVRVGSNTKTFTSVVVLQLVGEGKVDLDRSIETYLPGLVRGDGIDGRNITVRQLLQHTSGLPNYTAIFATGYLPYQHTYFEPRQMLDLAFAGKADFPPGTKFEYSNTNYVLAGLLIERVTGRPVAEEITNRIINKLGLRHTYFPNVGDQTIRSPHPDGYHHDDPSKPLTDVTVQDPSFGWAAGAMISTPNDVNRFFSAVLSGQLLQPAQLRQMRTTVDAPDLGTGVRYGLGLLSTPLSCGGLAWGHGGDIPGYSTNNAVTDDGRAATITVTELPTTLTQIEHLQADIDKSLCR
jgi:D-alanyl-D-alanine carboxypeptidase